MCRINSEGLISNIQHRRIVAVILFNTAKLHKFQGHGLIFETAAACITFNIKRPSEVGCIRQKISEIIANYKNETVISSESGAELRRP